MAVNERDTGGTNGGAERDPVLERLYREAAAETPPAHIDAAILAAARREVGARPRPISPMLRRWHVPVSIAAVVVVSVTLVILMRDEGTMRQRDFRMDDVARPEAAPVPASPPRATEEQMRKRSAPPVAAAPEPLRPDSRVDERPSEPSAPAAKPALPDREAASSRLADVSAARVPAEKGLSGRMETAAPSESPAAPSLSEARQAIPAAGIRAAKISGEERTPAWRGYEKEPPEKWLARIEELRKEGRAAEAEEMLSEFKRRFPGHPVPHTSR